MQPIHKSEELIDELTKYLENGMVINDFDVMKYLKCADKYCTGLEKNYVKGLIYGLNRNIPESIRYFELSLQVSNINYATNYIAFISRHGEVKYLRELAAKLAREYESPIFSICAYQTCLYSSNIVAAEEFMLKAIKLSNEEGRMKLKEDFDSALFSLSLFKQSAGFSQCEAELLSAQIIDIFDENNVQILALEYITDVTHDEHVNMYMVTAESDDPKLLANMNIQLAYRLADHDEFLDKKFSAIIRGKDNSEARGLGCL